MTLGEKLKAARLEAGLSQRQLCGDTITRNMLSQIENGGAKPSMDTLRCLAGRLGKPLSFFLDEDAVASPNQGVMAQAREAFDAGDWEGARRALEPYREPDGVYDRERWLLEAGACLGAAEAAMAVGRELYALELLEKARQAGEKCPYLGPEWEKRRLLLLGRMEKPRAAELCALLPSMDEELCLRARGALEENDPARAQRLLEAAQGQGSPEWDFLMGETLRAQGCYEQAAPHYHRAEDTNPAAIPALEQCYREMGDYRQAYFYACKQK